MTIPSAVRATVLGRFGKLGAVDREVLMCASAIGRCFEMAVLAAATARDEASVRATLERACELDMLVADEGAGASYCFRHALTRDIIYAELMAIKTRPLHRRIAKALECVHAAGGASLAELAYHAWAAGDARRALRYNERAGDEAAALYARDDARAYFARARSLLNPRSLAYARISAKLSEIESEPAAELR